MKLKLVEQKKKFENLLQLYVLLEFLIIIQVIFSSVNINCKTK